MAENNFKTWLDDQIAMAKLPGTDPLVVNTLNTVVSAYRFHNGDSDDEAKRLLALINTPEIEDFMEGVKREAAHQTERWGAEDEEKKLPHHYVMVYAKLLGKLSQAVFDRNHEKFKHHLITLAASGFNCHRQMKKDGTEVKKWFLCREEGCGELHYSHGFCLSHFSKYAYDDNEE